MGTIIIPRSGICLGQIVRGVACVDLCARMKAKAKRPMVVVGGSSRVWQYDRYMLAQDCARFDSHIARLCDVVDGEGARAISGEAQLRNLDIVDSIGHVGICSERIAFKAYFDWAQMMAGSNGRGRMFVQMQRRSMMMKPRASPSPYFML